MPGHLLNEDATLTCYHSGEARPGLPSQRVAVDGKFACSMQACYTVTGCKPHPPALGPGLCATAQWVVVATRVFIEGAPALLLDSQAICAPTGTGLIIRRTQSRVKGV